MSGFSMEAPRLKQAGFSIETEIRMAMDIHSLWQMD
jgi:hypothetical protein